MNRLARNAVIAAVVTFALLISACSLPGAPKSTEKHVFTLQADPASPLPGEPVSRPCLTLRVAQPESAPGLNTSRMAYRTESNRIDYFAYNEWVASPARMMSSLMEARLDESGMFGAVVTGSSDIRTDLRLDSTIMSLQQDFTDKTSSVDFSVKVNLVDVPDRSLADSKTFSYRVPAEERNAESGAAAANRAVSRFLDELAAFISRSIELRECSL